MGHESFKIYTVLNLLKGVARYLEIFDAALGFCLLHEVFFVILIVAFLLTFVLHKLNKKAT